MKTFLICFGVGAWIAYGVFEGEETGGFARQPAQQKPAEPAVPVTAPVTPGSSDAPGAVPATVTPGVAPSAGGAQPSHAPVMPLDPKEVEADRIVAEAVENAAAGDEMTAEEQRALLGDALGTGLEELEVLDLLDGDVDRLRQTLASQVGLGADTKSALLAIPGFGDELEKIGVSKEIADEIRALYPIVQSLRGEKQLLDVRTGRSESEYSAVVEANQDVPTEPTPSATTSAGATTKSGPRPHTPTPKLEAILLFHAGDVDGALEILSALPEGEIGSSERFVLGSCLVAKRRFQEARTVLTPLAIDHSSESLAEAARRQISRMSLLEAGLVGADPLVTAAEENKP